MNDVNDDRRGFFGAILIMLAILGFGISALAQNPYNPQYAALLEVSGTSTGGVVGAITVAIGLPTNQSPPCTMYQCPRAIVSMASALPPVAVACGSSPASIASAIAAGVNASGTAYTAWNPSPNRVLVWGPTILGQNGFWVGIFHGEIHPLYGYVVEPGRPVVNMCDGIIGNEDAPATGMGLNIRMVTIPDPMISSFEGGVVGAVIPANWVWDGEGQVSVEGAPQNGFPTHGVNFLRLSTQDPSANGNPLKLATVLTYASATPVLRIDYRWLCGEPGPTITMNDTFDISIFENPIVKEDTFTTVPTGTRSVTIDLREAFWYYYLTDGMPINLSFNLSNGGANQNDSVVLVDNIAFLPPQLGEGNNNYLTTYSNWFLSVSTQDLYHYPNYGTWDKTLMSGGSLTCYFIPMSYVPLGTTVSVILVASVVPYGAQPLGSFPGEPGIIGINMTSFGILHIGSWYSAYPPLSFILPPQLTFTGTEGLYLQAAAMDPSAPNGLRVTNLVRVRLY